PRAHRRRVREARVRGPRGVVRRSRLRGRATRLTAERGIRGRASRARRHASIARASAGGTGAAPSLARRGTTRRRRRRADARERRHRAPRRRRPPREHRLRDAERRLALELARRAGARLPARHARADVLAGGGTSELARAAQASANDALAVARVSERRPLPRVRNAGRRPAGPVVARLLPSSRRLRARPSGRDRRTVVPHEPLPELVLSARRASAANRSGRTFRRRRDRRAARELTRRGRRRRLVARTRQRRGPRERCAQSSRESARHAGLRRRSLMADFTVRPLRHEEVESLLDLLDAVAAERRWIASDPPIPRDRWREGFERNLDDDYCVNLAAV